MSILDTIHFMPALVSLLWVLTFMMAEKTHRQKILLTCMIIAVPYLLFYGLWNMPETDFMLYASIERFCLPLAMILLAVTAIYMNVHIIGKKIHIAHTLLLAPSLMYATAINLLYYIIGNDDAAKIYTLLDKEMELPAEYTTGLFTAFLFVTNDIVSYLGAIFLFIIFGECIYIILKGECRLSDLYNAYRNKHKPSSSCMAALFMMIIILLLIPVTVFPTWIPKHPSFGMAIAMALAIMLHLLCFTEFHSNKVTITPTGATDPVADNKDAAIIDEEEMLEKIMEGEECNEETIKDRAAQSAENSNAEYLDNDELEIDSIRVRRAASMFNAFTRLMVEEKIYLNPDLTVSDVAERLLVGRSTLSNMINHEYGRTFRSVLNDYRIYFAKQYMLDNPGTTQEVIAIKSGFKDASAFSHKFKDIVGISPLMWLTSQTKKESGN